MGLREDLDRFRKVGEEERQDLEEFIQYGEMESGQIKIPIKVVDLPEFEYDKYSMGGVGQGEGEVGQPVDVGEEKGEGDDGDEAGEEGGEHGYYEMNPEEFAEELDDRLGLDLDPKGKKVKEITEGALVEKVRSGPDATVDFEELYKKGLKRELALFFDEDYLREVMKVGGMGVEETFKWSREKNIPVSKGWIEQEYLDIPCDEKTKYDSIDDIEQQRRRAPTARELSSVQLRREDKRHKYPEISKEYEKNAVIIFIRDVSGSMGKSKRDLVERVFTPLDWYLTGKYDNAEFHYIAHDAEAWEVEREKFFGIQSGGGTIISVAYLLAQEILDENYPWSEWNRYVFAAGDGENWRQDTEEEVIPLMEEMDCNLHGYVQVEDQQRRLGTGNHGNLVQEHFGEDSNVAVTHLDDKEDVMDSIEAILSTEDSE